MGILDRLRGRAVPPVEAPGDVVPEAVPEAAPAGQRGWASLPPIQRTAADPSRHTVASAGFGSALATWQNPSFTGALSHAVLDGAPTGLLRDVLTPSTGPARLGEPALSLPVAVEAPEEADGPGFSVQRAVSASRPTGPRVAPVRARHSGHAPLTRATAPHLVQRRTLPAVRAEGPAIAEDGGSAATGAGVAPTPAPPPGTTGVTANRPTAPATVSPPAAAASRAVSTPPATSSALSVDSTSTPPPDPSVPPATPAAPHPPGTTGVTANRPTAPATVPPPAAAASRAVSTPQPLATPLTPPTRPPARSVPPATPAPAPASTSAPIQRRMSHQAGRSTGLGAPSSAEAPSPGQAAASATPPTAAGSAAPVPRRRPLLGAPLPALPPTAVPLVPRATTGIAAAATGTSGPVPGSDGPSGHRSASAAGPAGAPLSGPPRPVAAAPSEPAADGGPGAAAAARSADRASAPGASGRAAGAVPHAAVPGGGTATGVRQVQRSAEAGGGSAGRASGTLGSSAPAGPPNTGAPVRRQAPVSGPAASAAGAPIPVVGAALRAGTSGGTAAAGAGQVQRSAAATGEGAGGVSGSGPAASAAGAPIPVVGAVRHGGAARLSRVQRSVADAAWSVGRASGAEGSSVPGEPLSGPAAGVSHVQRAADDGESAGRTRASGPADSATVATGPVAAVVPYAGAPGGGTATTRGVMHVQRAAVIGESASKLPVSATGAAAGRRPGVARGSAPLVGSARPVVARGESVWRSDAVGGASAVVQRSAMTHGAPAVPDAAGATGGAQPPVPLRRAATASTEQARTASAPAPQRPPTAAVSSEPAGPAPAPVQRSTDSVRFSGVKEAFPAAARAAQPVTTRATPPMALPVQRAPATPSVPQRPSGPVSPPHAPPSPPHPRPVPRPVVVQRAGGGGGGSRGGSPPRQVSSPPPYDAQDGDSPPAYTAQRPPDSTGHGLSAEFDARELSDGQVDELTHRLVGPLTRLLRTELRLDRERIGRLRDPRR